MGNSKDNKKQSKGGDNMALLARPSDSIIMVDKDKSQQFLEESKNNIIKPDFLKQCQKFSSMIKRESNKTKG